MNNKEREKFWKTLCSLKGVNIPEDEKILSETIIYPSKIYRYRPVSKRTLDALKNNELFFSTSNYYDDPFDTFINVRIKDICVTLGKISNANTEDLERVVSMIVNEMEESGVELSKFVEQLKKATGNSDFENSLETFFRNIRNEIKKDTFSICFTESPFNESLWLKYAEQHKGFVLEYDLSDEEKLLCGKKEECGVCYINKCAKSLYPVYYSKKTYDATMFAQFIALCKIGIVNYNENKLAQYYMSKFGNPIWEREKITLIKKKCHKYDQEWRMILSQPMSQPVSIKWIPSAIYLGLNMNSQDMDLVMTIAKIAGVDKIYKCHITDDGQLNAILL